MLSDDEERVHESLRKIDRIGRRDPSAPIKSAFDPSASGAIWPHLSRLLLNESIAPWYRPAARSADRARVCATVARHVSTPCRRSIRMRSGSADTLVLSIELRAPALMRSASSGEPLMFGSMFHSMNAALTTASARSKASRADNEIADHEKEVVAAMDFGVVSSLDGSPAASAAAAVLAEWYASHSIVRRLWAIEAAEAMRIVIMLEPTVDGDDTQPAWLANSSGWAQELRIRMHRIVHLELVNEPSQIEGAFHGSRALTAAISWRDPTTEIG